jgi:RNA polymerase sigma-70 factor (ECF subfamily)
MTSTAVRQGPGPGDDESQGDSASASSSAPPTFAAVYAEYAQTVARWATRLGGPTAAGAEITLEVFVVVNRRLADFRRDSRVSTWLFGITAKVAANERRRGKLRTWWVRVVPNLAEGATASADGALEQIEKRERRALFYRALDRLGERHRRALILFELEELSIDEIAAHLDLRPGNVRVLLHRARAAFLKAMIACEKEQR